MEALIPILVIGGMIALVVGIFVVAWLYEHRRTERLRLAAAELGLEFEVESPAATVAWSALPLFSRGRKPKAANIIRARTGETDITIMDYHYTTGHGKSTQTHKQTLACISSVLLDLPAFALRPEGLGDRIAVAFGRQDIDFESFPVFSKKYLLQGAIEAEVRRLFHDEVILHFEQQPVVSVEGGGQALIYFQARKRIAPTEIRGYLEQAYRVFALFRTEIDGGVSP